MVKGILAIWVTFGTLGPAQQVGCWTVHEAARIGSADDVSQTLTRIGDILVRANSVIFIAQPSEQSIRIYDWSGRSLGSIGRPGEGPAEFKSASKTGRLVVLKGRPKLREGIAHEAHRPRRRGSRFIVDNRPFDVRRMGD